MTHEVTVTAAALTVVGQIRFATPTPTLGYDAPRRTRARFFPEYVEVEYRWVAGTWCVVSVRVHGPRVRAHDGQPSTTARGHLWFRPGSPEIPDYVATFVRDHTPKGPGP